jgi:hypothetical protein
VRFPTPGETFLLFPRFCPFWFLFFRKKKWLGERTVGYIHIYIHIHIYIYKYIYYIDIRGQRDRLASACCTSKLCLTTFSPPLFPTISSPPSPLSPPASSSSLLSLPLPCCFSPTLLATPPSSERDNPSPCASSSESAASSLLLSCWRPGVVS